MDTNTIVLYGALIVLILTNVLSWLDAQKLRAIVKKQKQYIEEVSATIAALWNGYDG